MKSSSSPSLLAGCLLSTTTKILPIQNCSQSNFSYLSGHPMLRSVEMGRARVIIVYARLGRYLELFVYLFMCLKTISSPISPYFISSILLQTDSLPPSPSPSLSLSLFPPSQEHHVCLPASTAFLQPFPTVTIQSRRPHSKRNRFDRSALRRQNKPRCLRCAYPGYMRHIIHQGCTGTHHYDHGRYSNHDTCARGSWTG